ncbi:hypothetical protein AO501_23150 [Mycobacterium gordonae]|uniref:Uncharacterized protein n=1 Tax=Mycobacterium gordonae TaxID=1778 RepID=A0A0Q2Q5Y5_MYCGO|nr:hypothetical protein [Mycobacterium]KQH75397.1 hypothetical protein AO501_23150 [Mycobacterium gordonae]MDP7732717.1 hypothetical protein [Mycobacterium sp. TY813]TDK86591.1 hypothetical protein EI067_29560 [Mycobacterium paragordonae]
MPATSSALACDPAATWKTLAPLLAARPTVRTWNAATGKFDRSAPLSTRLPRQPAAVALYLYGRTQVLALDFDTKRHEPATVDADFTRALTWITEAGGRAVTDRSTSGGRHILVPLAVGTSATVEELLPLLRLLEARLPSLDKTPMTNPKTGCITAPGSPCRGGGHRRLDGPLSAAVEAFTQRSDPALLPRLNLLLGALAPLPGRGRNPATVLPGAAIIGTGGHARLAPEHTRAGDLPARITAYAATGVLPPDTTWPSHSEARQSVLAHAALHGHSLTTIAALITPGRPWHTGLGGAYRRYHANAQAALTRDFHKALTWAAANAPNFRPVCAQDLKVHTRGVGRGPELHRRWLANAVAWIEREYPGHPYRWIGAAVYQALASYAVRAGQVINGVPVVGVGGRSLSVAAGLIAETTVWQFLRDTRDLPGSPLVRTRVAQGREPDYYALTRQNVLHIPERAVAVTRVEDVHLAWKVVGHRHRRVYELIVHRRLNTPSEVFAAAHVGSSSGYTTLAALATAGLITRTHGTVAPGPTSLDQIAAAHRLNELRATRIARHQRQRADWHAWLEIREEARNHARRRGAAFDVIAEVPDESDRQEYLAAVLATGPPTVDQEQRAIELLSDLLGAKLVFSAR